jgi:SAM-dependent methyltransferase
VELWVPEPDPERVFAQLVREAPMLASRAGLRLDLGPSARAVPVAADGTERAPARVQVFSSEQRFVVEWPRLSWEERSTPLSLECSCAKSEGGTSLTIIARDLGRHFGASDSSDLIGWFTSELLRPIVRAPSEEQVTEWWIDRQTRRPSGERARNTYTDPIYHRPNFLEMLDRLRLTPADVLLEVGCGGGAFLHDALLSGCRAMAIDHSPEMVSAARELNADAVAAGRLDVRESDAHQLPFGDASCTCAVSTGVLHFLDEPVRALAEVRRVLRPGGRLVVFLGSKELRGTPAAPEPMASRLHWYEDDELVELAQRAGFVDARVDRPDLEPYARRVGIPEEHLELFASSRRGGQLLEARRPSSGS